MARTVRSPRAGPRGGSCRLPGGRTTRSPRPPPPAGLAGVAGVVRPLDGQAVEAIHLRFGPPGRRVLVPLGPGQLVPIEVHDVRVLRPGERGVLAWPRRA